MDLNNFQQLGFGLSSLAIIFFIVKYFVNAVSDKDKQIVLMIKDFNTTINNFNHTIDEHIKQRESIAKRETTILKSLTTEISGLRGDIKSIQPSNTTIVNK